MKHFRFFLKNPCLQVGQLVYVRTCLVVCFINCVCVCVCVLGGDKGGGFPQWPAFMVCMCGSPINHHTHFPPSARSKIERCVNMTSPTHKHTLVLTHTSKHTHYDAIVSWLLVQNVRAFVCARVCVCLLSEVVRENVPPAMSSSFLCL